MIKEDVFEAKNKELDDLIEKTKQANKAAQDLDRNWYEVVGRTLEKPKRPESQNGRSYGCWQKESNLTINRTKCFDC